MNKYVFLTVLASSTLYAQPAPTTVQGCKKQVSGMHLDDSQYNQALHDCYHQLPTPQPGKNSNGHDKIGTWFTVAKLNAAMLQAKISLGENDTIQGAEHAKEGLDSGFGPAYASAKSRPELAQAVKNFYLAATNYFRHANRTSQSSMESAADKLEMELNLAHRN